MTHQINDMIRFNYHMPTAQNLACLKLNIDSVDFDQDENSDLTLYKSLVCELAQMFICIYKIDFAQSMNGGDYESLKVNFFNKLSNSVLSTVALISAMTFLDMVSKQFDSILSKRILIILQ